MKKKLISILTIGSMLLAGCQSKDPSVEIDNDVVFELLDVMTIVNEESNSIYYYYMASIENNSDDTYKTKEVDYKITDNKEDDLNSIDVYESMPITSLDKDESAYVYGYIGFPNDKQDDMGFYFKNEDSFLSFKNVNIRKASDKDIQMSDDTKFTLYEDDSLVIEVDASNIKTEFNNGNTTVSNFYINYKNKSDKTIVVPYLEPKATLNGLNLNSYSDKGDFSTMNQSDFEKIDFTENGLAPKTNSISGDAYSYIVEYLDPEQTIECNVGFTFSNAGINYAGKDKKCLKIDLISNSFGITHTMNLNYE